MTPPLWKILAAPLWIAIHFISLSPPHFPIFLSHVGTPQHRYQLGIGRSLALERYSLYWQKWSGLDTRRKTKKGKTKPNVALRQLRTGIHNTSKDKMLIFLSVFRSNCCSKKDRMEEPTGLRTCWYWGISLFNTPQYKNMFIQARSSRFVYVGYG